MILYLSTLTQIPVTPTLFLLIYPSPFQKLDILPLYSKGKRAQRNTGHKVTGFSVLKAWALRHQDKEGPPQEFLPPPPSKSLERSTKLRKRQTECMEGELGYRRVSKNED